MLLLIISQKLPPEGNNLCYAYMYEMYIYTYAHTYLPHDGSGPTLELYIVCGLVGL